jgi:ubiquinone/menaquinone biosynthesis C-methylase UbiE
MGYDAPGTYARLIGPRYAAIADVLVDAARLRTTDDVLEVGAGTGLVTARAAPAACSLVATDVSQPMLERARRSLRRATNVSYLMLDYGSPFPFLDGSFTVVLSGLTYLQDSAAALGEVERVLRPGGRLALSMWGSSYHEKRIMDAALESVAGQRFPGASPARAVRRLERRGFRSVRRTDLELTNRFAGVDDYIAYRRGFGKPTAWTTSLYERFLQALHREASKTAASDGSFDLGWTQTVITAGRPFG